MGCARRSPIRSQGGVSMTIATARSATAGRCSRKSLASTPSSSNGRTSPAAAFEREPQPDQARRDHRQGEPRLRQLLRRVPRRQWHPAAQEPEPAAERSRPPARCVAHTRPDRAPRRVSAAGHPALLGLRARVHALRQLLHRCGRAVDVMSEHPADTATQRAAGAGDVTKGSLWTATQVQAVVDAGLWPQVAIFVTWDDWGGWWDHVTPPEVEKWTDGTQFRYGGRVP